MGNTELLEKLRNRLRAGLSENSSKDITDMAIREPLLLFHEERCGVEGWVPQWLVHRHLAFLLHGPETWRFKFCSLPSTSAAKWHIGHLTGRTSISSSIWTVRESANYSPCFPDVAPLKAFVMMLVSQFKVPLINSHFQWVSFFQCHSCSFISLLVIHPDSLICLFIHCSIIHSTTIYWAHNIFPAALRSFL